MAHSLEAAVVVPLCLVLVFGAASQAPRFLLAERKAALELTICARKGSFPKTLYRRGHLEEGGLLQGRSAPCLETNPQKVLEVLRLVKDISKIEKEEKLEAPVLRPQLPQLPGLPSYPALPPAPEYPSLPWAPPQPALPAPSQPFLLPGGGGEQ